ncbi:sugar ABC transporter substrate-binding protein [Ktedonosporobacter rubrisoli]|uniref:Sugar ABC transporter substrate-binding protein n=1 Tax=Ktedonosporobacter rubrisoli TaxID=2509675 RepID=A0A4P6JXS3_KTERU|nr:sugar ABC transporter substrate-binding protein [Ktedonosporobacter rubrisoli]QBD80567.1 sugar ABC transporter substrate-binding protein [Ktedonosporobacter rubrisoli]
MKKSLISLSSVLLLLIMVLSACGGDNSPTQSSSSSNQPVTLRYGLWDKNQVPAMQKIIDAFKKTHPNISVNIEVTPYVQYWTKLETAATGGSAPDVFWMNGPNFIKYASNQIIAPLDEQISADKVSLDNYPSSLMQLYSYGGKHYALPKDFDTIGLWYNKALFDAAGVKYPDDSWTWDTLREASKKLTNPSKGVWGIVADMNDQQNFYNTIPQAGGYVISPDHKKSGFDSPESISGIQLWVDMIKDKSSPTLAQITDTTALSLFESSKVAMYYGGSWSTIEFAQNQAIKDKVDVAPLPQGKKRATVIHGLGNVISANTKYPKEAWEFVKFLGSKEAATIQADTGTVIPAYNGTQESWVKAYPKFNAKTFIDELAYSVPYPVSKNTSAWVDVQNKVLTKVWSGQLSAEDGCKQIAQQMNQLLTAEQQS